ncbi:MAG: LacI family transcriptional regulator [Lachnospiraceae bacterium]|nr:LacI family transcriptional regulator [Lachnospiraceae bacterium]MCI9388971.1 LacI family transcriptional regulator [Lachnospiraceae bacterium]
MGHVPYGRCPKKQASSTIGVIVPEISNAFFGDLFTGIEEIVNKNNLSLLYLYWIRP